MITPPSLWERLVQAGSIPARPFDIPGGRSLVVTPQEFRNKQLALKVRLQHGDKPVVDTTVRLSNGGNFLLGGPAHEGGVLVLSISATAQ